MALPGNSFSAYRDLKRSFLIYWKAYGGFGSFIRSPYLHFAAAFTAVAWPLWHGTGAPTAWYEIPLSVLPNVLGFTLGGYAILLSFGDESFRKLISGEDPDGSPSPFMILNETFIHFILVQVISIFLALLGKAWGTGCGFLAGIGFGFFVYSVTTAAAAAMAVLNVADWFDSFRSDGDS